MLPTILRNPSSATSSGILVLALLLLTGCSRAHYRLQADRDVRRVVMEKAQHPLWDLENFTIQQDPRSRYFSPYNPDYPPMPPDDPASHRFMHQVDGKEGYAYWHEKYGQISELENPGWKEMLYESVETTPEGEIILGLPEAVRLAYIHSPEYQENLETLYLSALDVTTERFRFDVQFFGGTEPAFEHLGAERPGGESNSVNLDSDFEVRRGLATAGELLVGFANSTVWEFAGGDTNFTTSLLNFSLIQPLLRAGGRAIALEQLTIAERALLANVRAFVRYRRGFYTEIAVGISGVGGPNRRGGFFGGTGLTGFTGQGAGGFGGVGAASGFGRGFGGGGGGADGGGGGLGAGGGAGQVGGFVGLLQQLQELRNRRENFYLQLRTLQLLEAHQEAGLIGLDQVLQFQQAIETERSLLLQAENSLQDSLDNFKVDTLGLPPDLPLQLDDSFIQPFQFVSPQMSELQNEYTRLVNEFGEIETPTIEDVRNALEQLAELSRRTDEQFNRVRDDLQELETRLPERLENMEEPAERQRLQQTLQGLREDLQRLRRRFEQTTGELEQVRTTLSPDTLEAARRDVITLQSQLDNLVSEMSLIQVRARLESVVLEPIHLTPKQALEIARAYRLDWMNNRAALVDTWRLIEFNANELQSRLDLRLNGDIGTLSDDNPLKFRDETGRLSASLEFDAPFTRLQERNNFRQQLINYQQARREMIQFEDRLLQNFRQTLRTLEQLELNLEIQRRAVAIATRRVDQARLNLMQPVAPPEPGQPPEQFGPTAARDLVDAIEALRDAQNNFMSVWINYYAGRMALIRDLGLMRIDQNGMWVEESLEEALAAKVEGEPLPPTVPEPWVQEFNLPAESEPAPRHEHEPTGRDPQAPVHEEPVPLQNPPAPFPGPAPEAPQGAEQPDPEGEDPFQPENGADQTRTSPSMKPAKAVAAQKQPAEPDGSDGPEIRIIPRQSADDWRQREETERTAGNSPQME